MISALVSLVLSVAASHGSAFNKMPNRFIMTSDSVFVLYLHTCVVLCDQSYFTFRHLNVHLHEYRLNKYDYKNYFCRYFFKLFAETSNMFFLRALQ